jgi:hypothetical protein
MPTVRERAKPRSDPARLWCADAGIEPPLLVREISAAAGVGHWHAWVWDSGRTLPQARSLDKLARVLRRPVGAVLKACLLARERRLAVLELERVRREAER